MFKLMDRKIVMILCSKVAYKSEPMFQDKAIGESSHDFALIQGFKAQIFFGKSPQNAELVKFYNFRFLGFFFFTSF